VVFLIITESYWNPPTHRPTHTRHPHNTYTLYIPVLSGGKKGSLKSQRSDNLFQLLVWKTCS